jgi:phosphoribosylaminoimidazole-succinocarboxamide synthase
LKKETLLYEGKAKKVYSTENPNLVIHYFKNDATAFDGKKKGTIAGKGSVNAKMTAYIFTKLEEAGIKTHFKELLSDNEILTDKVSILPVEVVARNIAAGSLSKRTGLPEGTPLSKPIVEFYYKNDELGDPLLTEDHIFELKLVEPQQLKVLREAALKINAFLIEFFAFINLKLVDFKLEFGETQDGQILLADEISPDTCRLWDKDTNEKMDKDRFRRDLGNIEESYQEVLRRVTNSGQGKDIRITEKRNI